MQTLLQKHVTALGGGLVPPHKFETLEKMYAGRPYHNMDHVLYTIVYAALAVGETIEIASKVYLALAYHDCVQETNPAKRDGRTNEEASADYFESDMKGILPQDVIVDIKRLIVFTDHSKDHDISKEDIAACAVVDADLSIFCALGWDYDEYSEQIREEYGWVDDERYRNGRIAVLTKFLDRAKSNKLYFNKIYDTSIAIENISREIAKLKKSAD